MVKSRYIKKEDDQKIKNEAGIRCAWCGCYLTIRHHIYPFSLGGPNTADNLILLCPDCHTDVHDGKISDDEIKSMKIELSGKVERSSGILSIDKNFLMVELGGFTAINSHNILLFNDIPLISMKNENGYLLLSLRLFNENQNLVCWMSDNRWWVDHNEILDFQFRMGYFSIFDKNSKPIIELSILKDKIRIVGSFNFPGGIIKVQERLIKVSDRVYMMGCVSKNNTNAIAIKETSFQETINGRTGWLINI